MNTTPRQYEALRYDPVRSKAFVQRAMRAGNLPGEYKPDTKEAGFDRDAFADAMIASFTARALRVHGEKSVRYREALADVEVAVDFLVGTDVEQLQHDFVLARRARGKRAVEVALNVAGVGGRSAAEFVDEIQSEEVSSPTTTNEVLMSSSIDRYVDLEEFIKELFHDQRINKAKAASLMLLFEQQVSSAPVSLQRQMMTKMCAELKHRMRDVGMYLPHDKHNIPLDTTFVEGRDIIKTLIRSPFERQGGRSPLDMVIEKRRDTFGETEELPARDYVLGHIGYVLGLLYPSKT